MKIITAHRKYYPNYTISDAWCEGKLVCYFLELPWKDNQHDISCIPVGFYICTYDELLNKYWVANVKNRELIQIHRGNSVKDTKGCLVTASKTIGGYAWKSTKAFNRLHEMTGDKFELAIISLRMEMYKQEVSKQNIKGTIKYA